MPSTAIHFFKYDEANRELLVIFTTGRRYIYTDVPAHVDADFKTAPSKGTFFNTNIRDRYEYRELEPSGAERER